jgi:hypothetical protein
MLPFLPLLEVYFVKKRRQARWDGKVKEDAQEVAVVRPGWVDVHEARCLDTASRAKDIFPNENPIPGCTVRSGRIANSGFGLSGRRQSVQSHFRAISSSHQLP